MESTLRSEPLYDTIRRLAELMIPEKFDWQDISSLLRSGYSKTKAIELIVRAAKQDPLLTKIRLHVIYSELRELANNGGLL